MFRYQLIVAYDDCTSKSERTNDLNSAITAFYIYVQDPTCVIVNIYDYETKRLVLQFNRP